MRIPDYAMDAVSLMPYPFFLRLLIRHLMFCRCEKVIKRRILSFSLVEMQSEPMKSCFRLIKVSVNKQTLNHFL